MFKYYSRKPFILKMLNKIEDVPTNSYIILSIDYERKVKIAPKHPPLNH